MEKLIAGIGIATFSTLLSAQQAFDGFNFQLGLGATQSQINTSNTNDITVTPNANINGTTNATSFNGLTSVGYSQSFNNLFKGFNFAGNLFYVIGNQSGGNQTNVTNGVSSYDATRSVSETLSGKYKLQNTWGISLEPGYYFSKNILGYLKFAYVNSKLNSSFSCATSDSVCLISAEPFLRGATSAFSANKTITGIGYGFGGKYEITKNIYGALDFLYVDYTKSNQNIAWVSTESTNAGFKPQQYMGFVSIGYKF